MIARKSIVTILITMEKSLVKWAPGLGATLDLKRALVARMEIRLLHCPGHEMNVDSPLLSGVPDYFDRNKILSGYDLSHYQVPHCIKSFLLFCLICIYSSQFSILF